MKLVIGLHHHRHGVDVHALDISDFPHFDEGDFEDYLGGEFERDREEWLELVSVDKVKKVEKVHIG